VGKVIIFAGGFGSGKSEIALNFAFEKAKNKEETILADLDLVNPFFASRELREVVESKGIRVVAPSGQLAFGDVPGLPTEIVGLTRRDDNVMIIDLAGDEVGTIVLGFLSKYLQERNDYEFYLVINPYRPFAADLESVVELKEKLERAAKMTFNGIISNPNLIEDTDINVIREGHKRVEKYARYLNIPVKYMVVDKRYYPQLVPEYGKLLKEIVLYLRPDWLQK